MIRVTATLMFEGEILQAGLVVPEEHVEYCRWHIKTLLAKHIIRMLEDEIAWTEVPVSPLEMGLMTMEEDE